MTEQKETKQKDSYAVGIDLGTTYSSIAVCKDDKVIYIPNSSGELTTPSVIGFTDTECLVGQQAREQSSLNPLNTIFENKRIIGRKFKETTVQNDIERYPFTVKASKTHNSTGKPAFEVQYKTEQIIFEPEQISALILSSLKHDAEKHLNAIVKNAVITVPAYFNDSQRQATKDAGVIAGLNVMRVINEPTAAAIAYGLDSKHGIDGEDEYRVLIFDLGGGTFDVSLLTIVDGFFEVKATAGDTHLGGEDFDNRITDYIKTQLIQEYIDKYPTIVQDIHSNPHLLRELRTRCERLKCELSEKESAEIVIEYSADDIFKYTLSRNKFEILCDDLFASCLSPLECVLRESEISRDEIDDVVLVGGSTRICKVRTMIQEFFNGKVPCTDIDPDLAVSHGAAVQATILSVNDINTRHFEQKENEKQVFLLDICPLSLGVSTDAGKMTVLIPRNTALPTQQKEIFTTLYDNQQVVDIEVYEGERASTRDNNLLGRFQVCGITKQKRGTAQIEVIFTVNENGILSVTAQDKQTQNKGNLVITNDKGRLTKYQIEQMILSAYKYKDDDNLLKGKLTSLAHFEHYLYGLKTTIDAVNASRNKKRVKVKSGFKLFSKSKKKKKKQERKSKHEEKQDDSQIQWNKIKDSDLKNMEELYKTYSLWLSESGINCVDSKPIDEKQNELESKLDSKIKNIIRDSYHVTRSLTL